MHQKCRFRLLEATMETTVSLHCAMKMKWIYSESKARSSGTAELSLLNGNSVLDNSRKLGAFLTSSFTVIATIFIDVLGLVG